MSNEELIEEASELTALFDEIRDFRKQYSNLVQRGAFELANAMRPRGLRLADMLSNAERVWLRCGEFNLYMQVPSGAVHTTGFCRTITLRTLVSPLPHLAGMTLEEMQAQGYRMCSHCLKRTPEQMRQTIRRSSAKWIEYLKNPI
ncbi:hypothetical protein SEA_IPHANE7_134 [Mycobacterium phage IPhane7]|uniref:Uncharacterized protein n=2 Tax=Bongovirus bongo TaxID=1983750 RepID=A0A385D379_9CAUD|nr:hypothetical protein SEA_IPHANE7_134 [Mycobacterium phage IPhane7]QGJ93259.1 hypothetical protein SEA_TYDAWG_131 [Mycobacterium phage TyDawg]WNM75328.1 hypothetical protein SEA_AUSPICE_136 [Mycobacterium phage Auspice]